MTPNQRILWRPNPGPQTRFLASRVRRVLYGGAAGGGKSAALFALPLRWIHNGNFRGLYLRREAKYLGDAIDKSNRLYPHFGGKLVRSPRIEWTFPSGATIWFNHCEHESDVANYDSFEFSCVLFDELTHFLEPQFDGVCARLRGTDPTLPYIARAASNPGGIGHEWVFERWGAWLNPEHHDPAAPGEARWFLEGEAVAPGTQDAIDYTFIPAKLSDNPHISTQYRSELRALDPVRRAQRLHGDWTARPAAGKYFNRSWFELVDAVPAEALRCRYWDRAATVDGDFTAGVREARVEDAEYFVEDIVRFRGRPRDVQATIRQTAELDGPGVTQVLEQDPGQAGEVEIDLLLRLLDGFDVRVIRPTGDKITRAAPWSARCEARAVKLVRGAWNKAFLEEHEAFPEGSNDDQVDAAGGAHSYLAAQATPYGFSRVRSTRR